MTASYYLDSLSRNDNPVESELTMLKIAIAQVQSSTDKKHNLEMALRLIDDARNNNAAALVLPEFLMAFSPASQSAAELSQQAEAADGEFVATLQDGAKASGMAVLAPIYERCPVKDRVYDTALWLGADGNISSVYRKLHLYDAFGFKESDKFHPGAELAPLVQIGGAHIGTMICYDLRFPEMARMLALQGAEVLVAPSGWVQGDLKVEHWQTMIKARALENGCFVIAPNQVGNIYTGHSMAVDPLGRTLADLGDNEGLALVDLDMALVAEVRQKLPLLNNRRSEVYRRYL